MATPKVLDKTELRRIDAYWRACNYLAAGMIYLQDNPLLREPLKPEHIKNRLLGHWGASPGLAFAYVHLNRLIKKYDLDAIFMAGPGHGAPGVLGPVLPRGHVLRGLPEQGRGRGGAAAVLQGVLLPRRHRQPLHARDAGLDPRGRRTRLQRLARVRRGVRQPGPARRRRGRRRRSRDRPARDRPGTQQVPEPRSATARCCRSCTSTATRSTTRRILARISHEELEALFRGYGWTPHFVEGRRPGHDAPGDGRDDRALRRSTSARIQQRGARAAARPRAPRWPMIVLRTPEGLDRPEGGRTGTRSKASGARTRCRSPDVDDEPGAPEAARRVAASYKPRGTVRRARAGSCRSCRRWRPKGARRMGANPHANGGLLRKAAAHAGLPRLRGRRSRSPARPRPRTRRPLGEFLRDIMKREHRQLPRVRPGREHARTSSTPSTRSSKKTLARRVLAGGRRRRRAGARRPRASRCSPSTRSRAGSKATCSPAGTASSRPTKRSCTSSTRCSTSTPSGWTSASELPWRAPVVVAEPADHLDRLAAGPQRLHAPGSRASSTSW